MRNYLFETVHQIGDHAPGKQLTGEAIFANNPEIASDDTALAQQINRLLGLGAIVHVVRAVHQVIEEVEALVAPKKGRGAKAKAKVETPAEDAAGDQDGDDEDDPAYVPPDEDEDAQ